MACVTCGNPEFVCGQCGMCQYRQMQQQQAMWEQTSYMRQTSSPQYMQYNMYAMQRPAEFHFLYFLFIGWWLTLMVMSLGFPLLLLLFSGGRKAFAAMIGYW